MELDGLNKILRAIIRDFFFRLKSLNGSKKPINLVFCNSFPKSGTHLLYDIIIQSKKLKKYNDIISYQSLSGIINSFDHINFKIRSAKSNSIIRSHLYYEQKIVDLIFKELKAKMIFITRDPRAVASSYSHWILKEPKFYMYDYIKNKKNKNNSNLDLIINGVQPGIPLGSNIFFQNIIDEYYKWTPWLKDKRVLTVKFEDLVGSRGGGDENKRKKTIIKILNYLDINYKDYSNYSSFLSETNKSHTFRKGQGGQINLWKKKFSKKQLKDFNFKSKELMKLLNY